MKIIRAVTFFILVLAALVLVLAGCSSAADMEAELGQKFSLPYGKTVEIKGEQLEITFAEILEDSRCASDVTGIWEGRVRCRLDVNYRGSHYDVVLAQPGLSYQYDSGVFQDFRLSFKVEPYPLSEVTLSAEDYYISLTIFKN